jgi:hypothetical protein
MYSGDPTWNYCKQVAKDKIDRIQREGTYSRNKKKLEIKALTTCRNIIVNDGQKWTVRKDTY